MPEVRRLAERFPEELVPIGVSSGKFPAERDPAHLAAALRRMGVDHPTVNDPDFLLWDLWGVRAWPTCALIDPEGRVRMALSGEFLARSLIPRVEELIREAREAGSLDPRPLPRTERPGPSGPERLLASGDRLFVAETGENRVLLRRLSPGGEPGAVLDAAGGEEGFRDGPFEEAAFRRPRGMALLGECLYLADSGNHAVRELNLRDRSVRTVCGTGARGPALPAGARLRAAGARMASPWDLAPLGEGLAVASAGTHQLWFLDPRRNRLRHLAGSGREDLIDGTADGAALAQPMGLAPDEARGRLHFVDAESSALRTLDLRERRVVTLVGAGLFEFGDRDGRGRAARLQHPEAVALLPDGALLVADSYNGKVRRVDPESGEVRSLPLPDLFEVRDVAPLPGEGRGLLLAAGDPGGVRLFDPEGRERPLP